MPWVKDERFMYFEAYMAGIRWAGNHASSCTNVAESLQAALDYAKTVSQPPDAQIMTEFGQGANCVADGIREFNDIHE